MSLLFESLRTYPIIAEVNSKKDFDLALKSTCQNIFLMQSNIFTIKDLSIKAKNKQKNLYIFVDTIEGYMKNSWGLEFILKNISLDGIISSNKAILRQSKDMGVFSLGYYPIYNSISVKKALEDIREIRPHGLILLPGILTDMIRYFSLETGLPVVSCGLIKSSLEVKKSLDAGAVGICTEKFNKISI